MRRYHLTTIYVLAFIVLFSASLPAFAQRPDLVWMAGGDHGTSCVAYSPDGKYLATGSGDGTAKLWRTKDYALIRTLSPSPNGGNVTGVTFSGDSSRLYLVGGIGLAAYSIPDTSLLWTASPRGSQVAVSPDGSTVVNAGGDIGLYNTSNGALVQTLNVRTSAAPNTFVSSLAYTPNGSTLAVGLADPADSSIGAGVRLYNTSNWSYTSLSMPSGFGDCGAVACTIDGKSVIASGTAGYAVVFALATGTETLSMNDEFTGYLNLATSPIANEVAVVGDANWGYGDNFQILLWNLNTGAITFSSHISGPNGVTFSPDGQTLAIADQACDLLHLSSYSWSSVLRHQGAIWNIALSPDGKTIASSDHSQNSGVQLWNASDGSLQQTITVTQPNAEFFNQGTVLGFSADNKTLYDGDVSAYEGGNTTNWACTLYNVKLSDGSVVQGLPLASDNALVAISTGNSIYADAHADDWIAVRSLLDGTQLWTTNNLWGRYPAFSPDGKTLFANSEGGIYLFQSANGTQIGSVVGPPSNTTSAWVSSTAFSPDGSTVAVGYGDGWLGLLNVASQTWQSFVLAHSNKITSLAFSPDGLTLATCSNDLTIAIWFTTDAQLLTRYGQETGSNVQVGGPTSICYSPDGKFFYYGRQDGTVCCALNPYRNSVFPSTGGNTGNVTVTIITPDIFPVSNGVQVTLTATGTSSVTGENTIVNDPQSITTTFNLAGASVGTYNLVITNPDGSTLSYPQGFTIDQGTEPQIVTNILGWSNLRAGPYDTYEVEITNLGNVDANIADLRIEVPNWFNWQPIGYQPQNVFMGDDNVSFAIQVPTIPALNSVTIPVQFQVTDVIQNAHRPFEILAWADPIDADLLVYIGDLAEPRILRAQSVTGEILDVFGQISNGIVTGVEMLVYTAADGSSVTVMVDSQMRPVLVTCSNGEVMQVKWKSSSEVIVTAINPDGSQVGPFDITLPTSYGPIGTNPFGSGSLLALTLPCLSPYQECQIQQWVLQNACPYKNFFPVICAPFTSNLLTGVLCGLAVGCFAQACDLLEKNPPRCEGLSHQCGQSITSGDPNDIEGPSGYGTAQWVPRAQPLPYTVFFSNDPSVSAPAQNITVTDQLDPVNLDLTTLNLGVITIGNHSATPTVENSPPVGAKQYDYDLDLRPDNNIIAHLHASLDMLLGTLTYQFQSLDPSTGLPTTDPNAGLLPPGVEGTVQFSVVPKTSSPTGTVTSNQATIVFDYNPPMSTSVWSNTLDNDLPISHVSKLASTQKLGYFTVKWSGSDVGSGLTDYTIYVSDNGGAYTPWLSNVTQTSAVFTGVSNHTYAFYSIARDNAGNIQPTPATPDTTTKVPLALLSFVMYPTSVVGSQSTAGTITLDGPAPSDTVIKLTSTNIAATVPATVTVPAGASSVSFGISTNAVTALTTGSIKASYNGGTLSQAIKVRPMGVSSVKLSSSSIIGGTSTSGTVTLEAPAAPSNITVSFASSNTAIVPTPTSITIPAGSQTGTFTVNTNPVTKSTTVTLKATANGITKSVKLTVTP